MRWNQLLRFLWVSATPFCLWACSAPGASDLRRQDLRGLKDASAPAAPTPDRPAATIDGKPVTRAEIQPMLDEAAGALILREIALDRAVEEACRARGIVIAEDAIEAERSRLVDSIGREAAADPADAGVLVERLRSSRGLGEARFARLLSRNAGLRALVKPGVEVTSSDVELALRIQYGQKFRVRVIVTATERDAVQYKQELDRDAANLDVAFARRAMMSSVDGSAARGGLLEPISPVDQAYPASIRAILPTLVPGTTSPVLAVDQGFAIVMLVERIEGVAPPEGAAATAEAQVRLRKERLAMEEAARRMLASMKIVPLDPGLVWSWDVNR